MSVAKSDFIHLHVHTQYSLLDGLNRVDRLVSRAAEFGMPSLAITDHGVMYGVVDFYESALKAGVKPILGCEMYVARGSMREKEGGAESINHLTLLASDEKGYRNLLALNSAAHIDGFYYKPRVDKEMLAQHAGGLVALSGCLKGEVAQAFVGDRPNDARGAAMFYRDLFGPERFYLELQQNGLPEQAKANAGMLALAAREGIPVVATNDCHYLHRKDATAHEIFLCIQTGKTIQDPTRMRLSTDAFYFRSPEEMKALFAETPEAIANTVRIGEMCNVTLQLGQIHLPHYAVPEGHTLSSYLRELAESGLAGLLRNIPAERHADYRARFEYELGVIEKMGFPGYFLIVWDFIKWARDHGIPVGPGRGSAAGSLVAWSLGITQLDPLTNGLLFERFLNPGRKSMPDIDVDFSDDRREEVIQYVRSRYGQDRVAQIVTFGTLKAKAAIRDVGRVLGMPFAEVDKIAKLVPFDPKMTIDKALEAEPRLKELVSADPQVGQLVEYARELEGLNRNAGTHAAGVVIAREPLTQLVPLCRGTDNVVSTQFHKDPIERIGLLKFDFLGIKTLTVISDAIRMVHDRLPAGERIDIGSIPFGDAAVFELLGEGKTAGVFQMESDGMTELTMRLKPTTFDDLVALISLYRPGPMGYSDDFVKRKHGKVPIIYAHPLLEPILRDTYGIILYQEQVMRIAVDMGGFTPSEADDLRKAMGKKIAEKMAAAKEKFITGAVAKKIKPETAETVYDQMAQFAAYGFNKSHAAAYAVLSFQTAWLKAHHPVEFMAALMTSESGDTDKIVKYMSACREMGITVQPPDVNRSGHSFSVGEGTIYFGLAAVKNVGSAAIDSILEARGRLGAFTSLQQFCREVDTRKVNKRVIESLVKAGAFDFTGASRSRLMGGIDRSLELSQYTQRDRQSGQVSIFGAISAEPEDEPLPQVPDLPEHEVLAFEKECLGFFISGHPLARHADKIRLFSTHGTTALAELRPDTTVTVGGILAGLVTKKTKAKSLMASGMLEDLDGAVEVVFFPKVYAQVAESLVTDQPVLVTGKVQFGDGAGGNGSRTKIHADKVIHLDQAAQKVAVQVHLRINATGLGPDDVAALRGLLATFHGASPVILHLVIPEHSETVIELGRDLLVAPGEAFVAEMETRFGPHAVYLR
jgi:DNA polymerase-3 subunit alpha